MNKTSEKLTVAFKALRKLGYFARKNFRCCQTCAWYEIDTDHPKYEHNAVFYHNQDNADLQGKEQGCYLAWRGDAAQIKKVLEEAGLKVEHTKPENRIYVANNPLA